MSQSVVIVRPIAKVRSAITNRRVIFRITFGRLLPKNVPYDLGLTITACRVHPKYLMPTRRLLMVEADSEQAKSMDIRACESAKAMRL